MARKKEESSSSGKSTEDKLKDLEKKYGIYSSIEQSFTVTPTGSLSIDIATGLMGTPLGKFIEIYGPESSGKSTIVLHQIAEYQKAFPDRYVALFDYEHSYSKKYAKAIGVDLNKLKVYQPDNQEDGYNLLLSLIQDDILSCAILDSHTAAIPKKIVEGDVGDATMGLQARNNSIFCGKIKGLLDRHNCTLFAISQTRSSIGGAGPVSEKPTGGNSFKFYSDMRWKIWKIADKEKGFNDTHLDVIKNKCAPPYGSATFSIKWGVGIDKLMEYVDLGIEYGLITKAGAWYKIDGEQFQGKEAMKSFLEKRKDYQEYIHGEILKLSKDQEINIEKREKELSEEIVQDEE